MRLGQPRPRYILSWIAQRELSASRGGKRAAGRVTKYCLRRHSYDSQLWFESGLSCTCVAYRLWLSLLLQATNAQRFSGVLWQTLFTEQNVGIGLLRRRACGELYFTLTAF